MTWTYEDYDAADHAITVTAKQDGTTLFSNSYIYDDFRGLETKVTQSGHSAEFAYDLAGRDDTITRKNGSSTVATSTYHYDDAGRLDSLTHAHGESYTYDPSGNRGARCVGVQFWIVGHSFQRHV